MNIFNQINLQSREKILLKLLNNLEILRASFFFSSFFEGRTALHMACTRDQPVTINYCLARGLSPFDPDYDGNTPLHIAAKNNKKQAVITLLTGDVTSFYLLGQFISPKFWYEKKNLYFKKFFPCILRQIQ